MEDDDADLPPPLLDSDQCPLPVWLSRPEIRYRVRRDGMIIGIETPNQWETTALGAEGEQIADPDRVLGTNLLDTMSEFYKTLFAAIFHRVSDGKSSVVSWRYCADSPGVCRHFMLWITRLPDGTMHFSSTQLDEHQRQPVFEEGFRDQEAASVEICGWCQKLRHRDGPKWQSPDTFHASLAQLGVEPPKNLACRHIACENCSKELSHNGMSWLPQLPRSVTDTHARLTLVCIGDDHLLLRELTVRVCGARPWHAVAFPVTHRRALEQPENDESSNAAGPPACASLPLEVAREAARVFILNNPACAAVATEDPLIVEWLLGPEGGLKTPVIGIASDDTTADRLSKAGCCSVVRRPQWKQLRRTLSELAK
ncbi:hypothetical protein DIPPA_27887 [Diplonema papillatum]|nr:hypothetical protein DIPPA_27887 [Diplonema papillatum]